MSVPNFTMIKSDLKLTLDKIDARPGALVIARPKDRNTKFSVEFVEWLSKNLYELLPPGVQAVILMEDSIEIKILEPEVPPPGLDPESWKQGWYDSLAALQRECSAGGPAE